MALSGRRKLHFKVEWATNKQVEKLTKKYINVPLSLTEIDNILKSITNYYISLGYITARCYLTPQQLKSGKLIISVVEGILESLEIRHNNTSVKNKGNIFPGVIGQPINLRDLEQGVDQINRLSSMDAKIDLQPGKEDGESVINLNVKQDKIWGITVTDSNHGAESTGKDEIGAALRLDNIFGLYDSWGLNYSKNLRDYDSTKKKNSYIWQSSVPFGYWRLGYVGTYFDYLTVVNGNISKFNFTGDSKTNQVELDRIIFRNNVGKTGLTFNLAKKSTNSYIAGHKLETGSYKLSVLGIKLHHVQRSLGGVFQGAINYFHGLKILGTELDEATKIGMPEAQFNKWNLDLSFIRPFEVYKQRLSWSTQIQIQYSKDNLFGMERISIGGLNTVRGFKSSSINGDSGAFIRNELTLDLYGIIHSDLKYLIGNLTAFAAIDCGGLKKDPKDEFERGFLVGRAFGLRQQNGMVFSELMLAKSIKKPSFLKEEGELFTFKVGISF